MNKKYLIIFLFSLSSCGQLGKNPFPVPGTITTEIKYDKQSSISGLGISPSNRSIMAKLVEYAYFSYTIEKIAISKDGKNWTTIFNGNQKITIEEYVNSNNPNKISPRYLIDSISVEAGVYPYARVWIGPTFEVKFDVIGAGESTTTRIEKVHNNFNYLLYPLEFSAETIYPPGTHPNPLRSVGDASKEGNGIHVVREKRIRLSLGGNFYGFYKFVQVCTDTQWENFPKSPDWPSGYDWNYFHSWLEMAFSMGWEYY